MPSGPRELPVFSAFISDFSLFRVMGLLIMCVSSLVASIGSFCT